MFDGWDGPEIATFWIAIGAAVLSVISLGWQAWTWRHSGAIVRVAANQSFPVYDHGTGDICVVVTATNKGRGPTTVTGWGFQTPGGNNIITFRPLRWSSPLPFPMPAGGPQGQWFTETEEIKATCQQKGLDYRNLRPWVRLSDDKTVFAKRRGIGLA